MDSYHPGMNHSITVPDPITIRSGTSDPQRYTLADYLASVLDAYPPAGANKPARAIHAQIMARLRAGLGPTLDLSEPEYRLIRAATDACQMPPSIGWQIVAFDRAVDQAVEIGTHHE
jgi:hypothetical protein